MVELRVLCTEAVEADETVAADVVSTRIASSRYVL